MASSRDGDVDNQSCWSSRCLRVGIDHAARRSLRRIDDGLSVGPFELRDVVAFDVLELYGQHARLCPTSALSELHVADYGFERGVSCVVRQRRVVGAAD